jgi:phage tail tape-measure protein
MALQTAVVGDVVQIRNAAGKTRNATVIQTQPAVIAGAAWSVANSGTGGTLTAATYSYRITQVVNGVESAPATAETTVVAGGTTNKCTITLPGVAGTIYKIYGRTGGSELLIGTTAAGASSFDDTGAVTPSGALPTADGRIGVWNPSGGLTSGDLGGTAIKATSMKSVNAYFKRT